MGLLKMSSAFLFNILGSLSELGSTAMDDDPNEVSYGPVIDAFLGILLPYVMLFFNGSNKRHKQCVEMMMALYERVGISVHLMNDGFPTAHPEGSTLTQTSMKELMGKYDVDVPDEADVSFVYRTHSSKNALFISNTSKLITLITYLISTYLPSEWGMINVTRFLIYYAQSSQPSMDVNVSDI